MPDNTSPITTPTTAGRAAAASPINLNPAPSGANPPGTANPINLNVAPKPASATQPTALPGTAPAPTPPAAPAAKPVVVSPTVATTPAPAKDAVIDLRANITKSSDAPATPPAVGLPSGITRPATPAQVSAPVPQATPSAPAKGGGLLAGFKAKWDAHVEKNKQAAAGSTPTLAGATTTPTGTPGKTPPAAAPGAPAVLTEAEKKQMAEAQKIYEQGLTSVRDLIAPSAMEFNYAGFRVSGMFAKSFFVFDYPGFIETNWLSPLINYDVTMDISMFVYPIDSATIMKFLRNKVAQLRSSISINAEKGNVRDPALEATLQDAEELRDSLQRGTEKMFQFSLYFTVYSDDEKKLEKTTKQIETILGGKLVMLKPAFLQMEHAFNSCLPQAIDEMGVVRNMNTGPLSTAFPFTSSDLTSNEGILYGLNRHNDSLIIFDRFKLENANSVIFAKSGAGKSYAVKLEILRSMMVGTDVIVIDPENEYEALATVVGGTYLRVSLNSDKRINPFDLPLGIKDEETKPGDLLRSNIISLQGLFNLMLGKITPEEEALIDKALIDVYALKGITIETVNPGGFEPPTMEDFFQILQTMDGADSLAKRVEKYVAGTYGGIFNKPTNIDLRSGMVVFCIRDLEDQLRPIAMYVILNYIWNRVRSSLKRRLMVIDEAWTMMQYEDSARFLFGLVKRARKYYLGISTITQDVEDFAKSTYGKPIITNSSMQLLLKQSPASIEALQKIFNLTEGEKYLLLNSGVGQGLFFAGNKHVAIQCIASYTEDKIITTNPEQLLKQKEDQ